MLKCLIERNAGKLKTYGAVSVTVTETTRKCGRPGKTSWLNEGQCLVLYALSRAPRAAAVRKQIIDVFVAYRAGRLGPAAPSPAPVGPVVDATAPPAGMVLVPADLFARIASALDRLNRPGGSRTVAEHDAEELAVLDRFLAAYLRRLPGGRVQGVDLWRAYAGWCAANSRAPLSDTKLARMLRHRLDRLDVSRPAYLDVALCDTARLPAPEPSLVRANRGLASVSRPASARDRTGRPLRAAAPGG